MNFELTWASATNLWNSSFSASVVHKDLPVVTNQVERGSGGKGREPANAAIPPFLAGSIFLMHSA